MSVFVPTGADVAVDPLDVLLVAPNGSTSTTLYLAQGQPCVVVALPADVVDELNVAAGLTGDDTLFTTPVTASEWPSPIYIAGAQVKRVQSSGAAQLGSMLLFALSGFMVTVPTVDLSDMVDLINATTTGGGGGTGIPVVGNYTPTVTPEAGINANAAPLDTFLYAEFTATLEDDANLVMVGGSVNVSALAGATDAALFTVTLPIEISGSYSDAYSLVATGTRWQDQPGTPIGFGVKRVNSSEVQVAGTLAAGVNYYVNLQLLYNRGGV